MANIFDQVIAIVPVVDGKPRDLMVADKFEINLSDSHDFITIQGETIEIVIEREEVRRFSSEEEGNQEGYRPREVDPDDPERASKEFIKVEPEYLYRISTTEEHCDLSLEGGEAIHGKQTRIWHGDRTVNLIEHINRIIEQGQKEELQREEEAAAQDAEEGEQQDAYIDDALSF